MSQKANKRSLQPNKDPATTSSLSATETSPYPKGSSFQPYVPLTSKSNKRKRDDDGLEKQEGFRDFMDTMQASGSKPTWSDGTRVAAATHTPSTHSPPTIATADAADGTPTKRGGKNEQSRRDPNSESGLVAQDDSSSAKKKKRRKKPELAEETSIARLLPSKSAAGKDERVPLSDKEAAGKKERKHKTEAAADDGHESQTRRECSKSSDEAKGGVHSLEHAYGFAKDDADHGQPQNVKNDSDWLRERTNRVLDLVDHDEIPIPKSRTAATEHSDSSSHYSEGHAERQMPAASVAQQAVEQSLANGRLFIRNLPYSASEAEIQDLFAKYGKVTEVSHYAFRFLLILFVMIS